MSRCWRWRQKSARQIFQALEFDTRKADNGEAELEQCELAKSMAAGLL